MRNIINLLEVVLGTIILLVLIAEVNAETNTKTFIKEYTYQAGTEDSLSSCRVVALREVKRLLLEELGTYLESESSVKSLKIEKDQITVLTAGIVSTEIIDEKWNGMEYWLKARITANPQDVIEAISNLRNDRVKVKELEALKEKSIDLLKENDRLNKELKLASDNSKSLAKEYSENIEALSALEWFEKGYNNSVENNHVKAQENYSKAIELDDVDVESFNNRGVAYAEQGKYQLAINDYTKAIELNPSLSESFNNRGVAYYNLEKYQLALKDLNKAIELDPKNADAYNNLGNVYYVKSNFSIAIKNYNKTLEINPSHVNAIYNKSNACEFGGSKVSKLCGENKVELSIKW